MNRNEAIIRRYVDELNDRNLAILDEVVSPSVIFGPDETLSLKEYRQLIVARIELLPGYHVTIDRASANGDEVSIEWTYRGKDQSTGEEVVGNAASAYRIVDGRIAEVRSLPGDTSN
jgi:predicted ester cyclase